MIAAPLQGVLAAIAPGADAASRVRGPSPNAVARDFEALLVAQLIGAMRRTVPGGGLLQASASRRTLDGAFDYEMARALVAGGGMGIARQIAAQIDRGQGQALPAPSAAAGGRGVGAAEGAAIATERVAPAGVVVAGGRATAAPERENGRVTTGATEAADAEAAVAATRAQVPVDGTVTSRFGLRRDPFTGRRGFHQGIDLAAPRGTAIRAAADGEVVFSGWRGRAGNVVEVRHGDGLVTSYAHAERVLVARGQKVVGGEVIATVGSSGRSTGPHLHFAARRDGQVIDPAEIMPEAGASAGAG